MNHPGGSSSYYITMAIRMLDQLLESGHWNESEHTALRTLRTILQKAALAHSTRPAEAPPLK